MPESYLTKKFHVLNGRIINCILQKVSDLDGTVKKGRKKSLKGKTGKETGSKEAVLKSGTTKDTTTKDAAAKEAGSKEAATKGDGTGELLDEVLSCFSKLRQP